MKMNRMMVVAAALAAGTSFGAIRAVTPTDWNGKPGSWQMKRHAEKMSQAAAGGVKVVFIVSKRGGPFCICFTVYA